MADKSRIIHLGSVMTELKDLVKRQFTYVAVEAIDLTAAEINTAPLFVDSELNSKFRNDYFLITDVAILTAENISLLAELPANAIILSDELILPDEIAEIWRLKNVQRVRYTDVSTLGQILLDQFFTKQLGYKLEFDQISINPQFSGTIDQLGHNYLTIHSAPELEFTPALNWNRELPLAPNSDWEIRVDYAILNEQTEFKLHFKLAIPGGSGVSKSFDITNQNLNQLYHFRIPPEGGYLTTVAMIRGEDPQVQLGNIHVRQSHANRGDLMIGGHELIDLELRNTQLLYYFDAGDMKPPLNVYFGGYRPAEGYEAIFMMRSLKSPFIIFSDPRLEGGAFYLGSNTLKQRVVDVVKQTVERLGFESNQVITTGLSMGTFAALYYSAKVQADWTIVGKPLVNLGDIASNERIKRPNGFPTSLDLVQELTGGVAETNMQQANEIFWQSFKNESHAKTGFVFSYMYNDDYDLDAFEQLSKYLKEVSPQVRILHKGLIGRHNDDTPGIVSWYLQQFKNILTNEYSKDFED